MALVVAALLLASCSYHEDKVKTTGVGGNEMPMSKKATFTWINANVIQAKCIGCHSANSTSKAKKYPFDSYQDLIDCGFILDDDPGKADLYTAIKEGRMPPGRQLPDHMIAPVAEWIKKGAPQD